MTEERRKEIKKMYLEYLSDIPVHKWACKYCRIDVKTSINWREEDKDFSNACEVKISEFVDVENKAKTTTKQSEYK
jgi:hypothetical protein